MTTTTIQMAHHHLYRATHPRQHHGRTVLFPLLFLFLLLSLLCSAKAQPSGSSSRDMYGNFRGGFSSAVGVIVVILISAFFFMVFFSIYLRQCSERADPSAGHRGAGVGTQQGARSRRSAARGVDPAVVQALPTLVYAEVKEHKIGKGALECAVCLCEFEDDETLRLLPTCDHVFHTDCIDAWLSSHTTCPVCRSNLAAHDPNATEPSPACPPADAGTSAAAISEETETEGGAGGPQDHVAIVVEEPEAGDRLATMESKSRLRWRWSRSMPRFPRSHSTGHSMATVQPAEACERYILRLPDHIRRDVIAGKFQRSSSCAAYPAAGEGSTTRKCNRAGSEGTSRGGGHIGGRSFKLRRWEWAAKSDRWAFFARTLSMVVSRGDDGGAGEGSSQRGEGSSRKGGGDGSAAAEEGSVKGRVFPAA